MLLLIVTLFVQFVFILRRRASAARVALAKAFVLLLAAATASGVDQAGILCEPDSWLQGHAIWCVAHTHTHCAASSIADDRACRHCLAASAMLYLHETYSLLYKSFQLKA